MDVAAHLDVDVALWILDFSVFIFDLSSFFVSKYNDIVVICLSLSGINMLRKLMYSTIR
jgi:hypothetical protein